MANFGTIASDADALEAVLPTQTGNAGKVLGTNGTVASWVAGGGGSGTVTVVSVTAANGVSGSVATDTTTPAISLTLGAITPTTVNSVTISGSLTPTLAVTGTTAVSGTNTGNQTITLTGDVTGSGTGSFAATIADSAVTLAKMANLAANGFIGNNTDGVSVPIALTVAQAKTLLSISGTNTGDQTITLTGDVTGSGTGSFATAIAAGAVTLANMDDLAANSILGNNTGVGATPIALTISQTKTLLAIANTDVSGLGTLSTQSGTFSGTSSGTNTGDQSSVSGNAGTATALATARAIYGNNFDGSAALTQIIASGFGGTGNGFTKFSGPTTAERTFTLPDASSTILTSNDLVTVAQGGTGRNTATTAYALLAAGTTAAGVHQTLAAGATTEILVGGGASALPVWTTASGSGAPVRATSPTLTTAVLATKANHSGSAGAPAGLAAGDRWYDTTAKSHNAQSAKGKNLLRGIIYRNTSASTAVNATNAETAYDTSFAFPADSLTVGTVLRIRIWGLFSAQAGTTPTYTWRLRFQKTGPVNVYLIPATAAFTSGSGVANMPFEITAEVIVQSIGSSGTFTATSERWAKNTIITTAGVLTQSHVGNTGPVTFDTTAIQTLQCTVTPSASHNNNTTTIQGIVVEVAG